MNIDKELNAVLRRTAPPVGFSDRVLARVRQETSSKTATRAAYAGGWTRIAAAVLLVVSTGLLSSTYISEIRQNAAGERAKQELLMAMKIASEKTNLARQEVMTHDRPADHPGGDQQ